MDRPHEGLVRAETVGLKLRSADEKPVMAGRFAAPGEWTEINSIVEGHFMERTAPGAFDKTLAERKDKLRVLYHHGLDPFFGFSPLGPIRALNNDTEYEVELLDTDYNKRLVPMLEAGVLGSSFRFDVIKEDVNLSPMRTDWNPQRLPEVTLTEVKVKEFGPTPIPAYSGATAGLRSVTDEFLLAQLHSEPDRLLSLVESLRAAALQPAKPGPEDGDTTSLVEEPPHSAEPTTREEDHPSWLLQ